MKIKHLEEGNKTSRKAIWSCQQTITILYNLSVILKLFNNNNHKAENKSCYILSNTSK